MAMLPLLLVTLYVSTLTPIAKAQQFSNQYLHDQMVKRDYITLASCEPFSQHVNDKYTIKKTNPQGEDITESCYNGLAGIVESCQNGLLSSLTDTICQDQRITDFKQNNYDPVNRPYNAFEGLSLVNSTGGIN